MLEGLDLSRSFLQDDDINVLCQGLVLLRKLKYLNLSRNMIDSKILDDAWFLPQTLEELILGHVIHGEKLLAKIEAMHNLKKLHLANLRACDVKMLATTLSSLQKLEELSLHFVTGSSHWYEILFAIKSLGNIRKIDLSPIKLFNLTALADMLSSLLSLEELVLTGMSFVQWDDLRFFSEIKLLKRLRKLDLRYTKVREEKAFFDMLSSLSMLEEIVFPVVVLENSGDKVEYFSALRSLIYLKNLDLYLGKTCESAINALARVLPSLVSLEKLVLRRIDCFVGGKEQLFSALGNLKNLQNLHLSTMTITETETEALAGVLPSLGLLRKLVLFRVFFEGSSEDKLFTAIHSLRSSKKGQSQIFRNHKSCCNRFNYYITKTAHL